MQELQKTLDMTAPSLKASVEQGDEPDYLSIEGMKGQEYSIGIFIFMLVGILVFIAVIIKFIHGAKQEGSLKRGERVMLIWIMVGTIAAAILGALQLLEGQLL